MTLMQEAYTLMQKQPESNIKIIVELLRTMSPSVSDKPKTKPVAPLKRTGMAKGVITFPADFDDHFDDLNEEIAAMFSGEAG